MRVAPLGVSLLVGAVLGGCRSAVLTSSDAGASVIAFAATPTIATNGLVGSIVAADLNADGHIDLLLSDYNGNSLTAFLGVGDGSFSRDVVSSLCRMSPTGIRLVATTDFNRDGAPDAVVGDADRPEFWILLGQGDGSFGCSVGASIGSGQIVQIAIGDLDGNQIPDVAVVAAENSPSVHVFYSDGVGGVRPGPVWPDTGQLVIADLNNDGWMDVVSRSDGHSVSIKLGGIGGFSQGRRFVSGGGPGDLAAGDFDSDGFADVIAVDYLAAQVSLLLGANDGSLKTPVLYHVEASPRGAWAPNIADFDRNGTLDVALLSIPSQIGVFPGRGTGSLGESKGFLVAAERSEGLAGGDFNEDGLPDLAVAVSNVSPGTSNGVVLCLNVSR